MTYPLPLLGQRRTLPLDRCSECNTPTPTDEFVGWPTEVGGNESICRDCFSQRLQDYDADAYLVACSVCHYVCDYEHTRPGESEDLICERCRAKELRYAA